ncbi:hypothetical protein HTZ84_09545 [Haloterrigena sp. SYSU A558-1]|uniref:Uncharacterized protein n=1 Tax=Haloterrigena gelatinilytica TaxID=2741724 RepID=A0ABX2L8F7_9EURY|nr:hypothetical protein [Haloterrigena gelatinilytica]NUC72549.1 hypothetical protein [Haloterrigena gelatinilytica]
MAVDDETLAAEVRVLTDYDAGLIADGDLLSIIELAKTELRAQVGQSDIDFYGGNLDAERALFWLTCLFLKAKIGELDAPNFSISELQVSHQAMDEQAGFWLNNLDRRLDALRGTSLIGHVRIQRADRTYNFEN